jgi:hypothetical protein
MKTVLKQNGQYIRMSDDEANSEVLYRRGKYVSKVEWKQNSRDIKVTAQLDPEAKTKNTKTKSKKLEKRSKLKEKQRH